VINKKHKAYRYKDPQNSLIKNIITKFETIRTASRYQTIRQTEIKTSQIKKTILIEPNLKMFGSFEIVNYKKIIRSGYNETKKYFDKAEKQKARHKRRETPLEKIINFPIKGTREIIKNIKKLN